MADKTNAENKNNNKKRFASLTEAEYENLLQDRESRNTRKATDMAVRTFRSYLQEKDIDADFETKSAAELDLILCKFFTEARATNGETYKKTTLIALRHGLSRYLINCDTNLDIINSSDFKKSQTAFKAMVVQMKKEGKGVIEHHPPVDSGDLLKLYDYFYENRDSHEVLQSKVLVDVMLHFARRGRENLRDLKIKDFWLTTDGDENRYIYLKCDELTKNHQTDNNTASGRMYEIKESDRCPVQSFIKYKRKLNPGCPNLFQRARSAPNKNGYLFDCAPIGHNKLGSMMSTLSDKANLSKKYTNHSLRATSVHVLDSAQIPTRHIMSVTGHKAETSLKTYTGHTDSKTKKLMSHTIAKSTGANPDEHKERKKIKIDTENDLSDINLQESSLVPVTDSQLDNLLDDLNSDPEFDQLLTQYPLSASESVPLTVAENAPAVHGPYGPVIKSPRGRGLSPLTSNVFTCNYQLNTGLHTLPQPVITGQSAQVTINYNIFNQ